MLLSVRWLNSFFTEPLSLAELLDALERSGLEVEEEIDLGLRSGKIVVAKVLEIEKHPDADRLVLVKADVGAEKPAAIVCGATNLRPGMLVPCALPKAVLPGGLKIAKSKIRGQTSEGMLCSARELNFGTDHSGIMELPETLPVGEPFDFIVDIKVTPNRADCLSALGVARDVAALAGRKVLPVSYRLQETVGAIQELLGLTVQEREGCPRYTCRYVSNVQVGPSPLWMTRKLEACGERSINNIVDVTNYVMLELGTPLHAFDAERIRGAKIVVRLAERGEKLVTLDETEVELDPEDLIIADAEGPIALAGVMGGKGSQVTEDTKHIVLECACFDPTRVRATARRHSFQTESSYRFERGVDREELPHAVGRAAQLVQEIARGEVVKGLLDSREVSPDGAQPISLDLERVNRLLGLELTNSQVADYLVRLGFEIRRSDQDSLLVAAPSYRMDIALDVDLIEEVARVAGYNNIPETMPAIATQSAPDPHAPPADLFARARHALVASGFSEAIHASFTSKELTRRHGFDPEAQPGLVNPLTADQSVMRPTLLSGLIETARNNRRQGAERVALFEIGRVFPAGATPGREEDEKTMIGFAMTGDVKSNWARPSRHYDFYDLKYAVETLGDRLGLGAPRLEPNEEDRLLHPGRSASVAWQGDAVGTIGELHPDLADQYDLRDRLYVGELDLDRMFQAARNLKFRYREISRFPSSQRDLALVVDADLPAGRLLEVARSAGDSVVEELSVVDLYRGEHIDSAKKSVALRFRLRSAESTLTEEEIKDVMAKILEDLKAECGAELRS